MISELCRARVGSRICYCLHLGRGSRRCFIISLRQRKIWWNFWYPDSLCGSYIWTVWRNSTRCISFAVFHFTIDLLASRKLLLVAKNFSLCRVFKGTWSTSVYILGELGFALVPRTKYRKITITKLLDVVFPVCESLTNVGPSSEPQNEGPVSRISHRGSSWIACLDAFTGKIQLNDWLFERNCSMCFRRATKTIFIAISISFPW